MRNISILYIMEISSGVSRGSYLACIGWTALLVSDDVARVGQVVIVAMLTNILAGPVIGVLVDRQNRRNLMIGANLGISFLMACLGFIWLNTPTPALIWLFLGVMAITALRLVHQMSHDGLIKSFVPSEDLLKTIARFRAVHLLTTAAGMAMAGTVIEFFSAAYGFVFSALFSGFLVAPLFLVNGVTTFERSKGLSGFAWDFIQGFQIFKSNISVLLMVLLAAVSLPVGQLVNAILSSLIRDDLGHGSAAFGFVDSAWAIGGMAAAAVISLGPRFLTTKGLEYAFSAAAGGMTICFALLTSIPALAVLHGAMGFTVWLCRILLDGNILRECGTENVGRTRVYVEVCFSVSAIVMCLSPTLVELPKTADYFLVWGIFMLVASIVLWIAKKLIAKHT